MTQSSARQVVIVYDATVPAACSRTMQLVGRLSLELRLSPGLWTFHELETDAALCDRTAAAAVAAEVVIFSMSACDELPARVMKWAEAWLPLKKGSGTDLALLLDPEPASDSEPSPICTVFRRMTQRVGLDFFFNTINWPQHCFEDHVLLRLRQSAQAVANARRLGSLNESPTDLARPRPASSAQRRRIS